MGHWRNSTQQVLSAASGAVTIVDFDEEIVPGSQIALQDGIYDYAYHVNLIKPSGEIGPSRVKSVLAVKRASGEGTDRLQETQAFIYLDSGTEGSLTHTGQTPLSVGDEVQIRVNLDDLSQSGIFDTKVRPNRSSLSLDLVGASASGNFARDTFPIMGMGSGQPFFRTDFGEQFNFDGSRWLGQLRADGGGRNGNQNANTYFRRYNGMLMTATRGIYIPFDAVISCVTWTKGDTTVGNIQLQRDGVALADINADAAGGGVDTDINFAANGVLSLFWNSGNQTNNMQITIHYRRVG